MKVYVLYIDYGVYDGCSEPCGIVISLTEAEQWKGKYECNDYKIFDISNVFQLFGDEIEFDVKRVVVD